MKQTLKIYVERLRGGSTEQISEVLDPAFMDIAEKELVFSQKIEVEGDAYLAEDWLIVTLSITAFADLHCAFCNDSFCLPISIKSLIHEEALDTIRDASFDLLPLIRESILLEIPFYPQCGITKCNRRQEIEGYLKDDTKIPQKPHDANGHQPFQDLL